MSHYKRAEWKSGLVYAQMCDQCRKIVKYTDDKLDFRPWFPDGFVYCPRCKKPLRHNEKYAITANYSQPSTQNEEALFCTKCGNRFGAGDNFCSKCGNKR